MNVTPIMNYEELAGRFPGIESLEPSAIGKFVFHAALHTPPESFAYGETDEPSEEWHYDIRDILSSVRHWQEEPNGVSRYEFAKSIERNRQDIKDEKEFSKQLNTLPADEAYELALNYLKSRGFGVVTELAESPLFPHGRTMFVDVEDAIDTQTGRLYIPYNSTASLMPVIFFV
jgi:hypothetical protein